MGKVKKAQNAASRKDVFYKRAKEQGYRARSAFKLIHLNNLHGFLKTAKVCIDLCAAPGSWMQVAHQYMPSGSVIVGVDLFSIKKIPGTISIKGDITTESLRTELRSTIKEYKADVVIHDGAPNVGKNWAQDSYEQNLLVLHAFKLASEFLRCGGTFVTKVFRCKDTTSLEYVFKQLFKNVVSNKPVASRYESAETFYVCSHFKLRQGDKVDPKFFDPKEVFKEIEAPVSGKINLHKPEKVSRKAIGYEDGVEILFKETPVTEFVESDRHEELLQQTNALTFDHDKWRQHVSTTEELVSCCQDIKVLGRKELKMLLTWRKGLRAEQDALNKLLEEHNKKQEEESSKTTETVEEDEMEKVQQQIDELKSREAKEGKKQQKAIKKQRRQLQQRLKTVSMMGSARTGEEGDYFSIAEMENVNDDAAIMEQYDASDSDNDQEERPKYMRYRRGDHELDDRGTNYRGVGEYSDTDSDISPDFDEDLFGKKKKSNLKRRADDDLEIVPKEVMSKKHKKAVRFADGDHNSDDDSTTDEEVDEEEEEEDDLSKLRDGEVPDSGVGEDEEEAGGEKLITDLMGDIPEEKKERTAESWFSQDIFNELESDVDEDMEVDAAVDMYKRIGGEVFGEESATSKEKPTTAAAASHVVAAAKHAQAAVEEEEVEKDPTVLFKRTVDADLEVLTKIFSKMDKAVFPGSIRPVSAAGDTAAAPAEDTAAAPAEDTASAPAEDTAASPAVVDGSAVVPDINTVDMTDWGEDEQKKSKKRLPDLSILGLAIGNKLIMTKKARRDLALDGWNRYIKGEEPGLPDWFVEDEDKHLAPYLDVKEEDTNYYAARDKAVNVRTLKKVMEAKVRKQRRFKKTMQKVMKKTEAMQGSSLLSDYEKQQEVKNMYKKAMKSTTKKDTTYVVMSKKNKGKKPKGTTGRYKLVDARLKSDVRAKLKSDKKRKTVGRKGKKH